MIQNGVLCQVCVFVSRANFVHYVNVHVCIRTYSQCLPCLPASVSCNWQSTGEDNSFQVMLETEAVAQGSGIPGLALKVGKDVVSVADAERV